MQDIKKRNRIILILSILGLLLILAGITYAYFAAVITGAETTSTIVMEAGELEIEVDGGPYLTANSFIPDSDNPWITKTFTLTGKNTTIDLQLPYTINLVIDENTFTSTNMLYSLTGTNVNDNGKVVTTKTKETVNPTGITSLGSGYFLKGTGKVHEYTLSLFFPETDVDQSEDMHATFKCHINIVGDRSEEVIEIKKIEDLIRLSNDVKAGDSKEGNTYVLVNSLDFNDASSYEDATATTFNDINGDGVTEDIKTELTKTTGAGFPAIGNTNNKFSGNFYGNNKEIKNIFQKISTSKPGGLFGGVSDSNIKDLTISGEISRSANSYAMGGIVAYSYGNTTLENCTNNVNITSSLDVNSIGGLVGDNKANLTIKNGTNNGNLNNSNNLGGLVGVNEDTLTINSCNNTGNIRNVKGASTGGVLGRSTAASNATNIKNCTNNGVVSNLSESEITVTIGGLIGRINGTLLIENSHNKNKIENEKNSYSEIVAISIGGLVGSSTSNNVVIKKSSNSGNILGGNRNGGMVGYVNTNSIIIVDKSFNTGNISSSLEITDSATASGGIIGYGNNSSEVYVLNSYNTGAITSNNNIDTNAYAGGIIGNIHNNTVTNIFNSYNTNNITISSNSTHAGGIFTVLTGTIKTENVYNTGTISSKYGLGFIHSTSTNTINNSTSYYLSGTGINGSSVANVGTAKLATEINNNSFITTLNNNIESITLPSIVSSYSLSTWSLRNGHPTLNN